MRNSEVESAFSEEAIRIALRDLAPGLDFNNQKLLKEIKKSIEPMSIKKGEKFLLEGQVCTKLGLLLSGNLKAFFFDTDGKLYISRFYCLPENPIVVSMDSFRNGVKANETIVAVSNCVLLAISRENLEQLYTNFPEFNALGRNIAEESYCEALRKLHDFKTLTTEQRVKLFWKENKRIFGIFPKKDIAAYLGVSRFGMDKILKKHQSVKK